MKSLKIDKIGFKIVDDKLELILPEFIKKIKYTKEEELKLKVKYLKLFRKYRKYSTKDPKMENINRIKPNHKQEYIYSIFEAYYLLLIDYLESGPFIFNKKEDNHINKGRVNWNKTINKSKLVVSNGNYIYNHPYYSNYKIYYTHPLTILYGIHLLEVEKYTGIKLNISNYYRNIIRINERTLNRKEVLDNYKFHMYSDRERKVYTLLEIINKNIRKLDKISTNLEINYLENINNLWEHMLKVVLEDEYYKFKKYFPKGKYNIEIEDNNYNISGLRIIPDIIKEHNNKLYIIDAKNYLPHINGNMPSSIDINKQILYRYFLSKEFNSSNKYSLKDIKNIFILPNDIEEKIKYIGSHKIANIDNSLGDIFLYQMDFEYVVDKYLKNQKIDVKSTFLV